jgi:hypothetical protein
MFNLNAPCNSTISTSSILFFFPSRMALIGLPCNACNNFAHTMCRIHYYFVAQKFACNYMNGGQKLSHPLEQIILEKSLSSHRQYQ